MSHPDKSHRVGAIYRCCVRYGKDKAWAHEQLSAMIHHNTGYNPTNLADIWFRGQTSHMDTARKGEI